MDIPRLYSTILSNCHYGFVHSEIYTDTARLGSNIVEFTYTLPDLLDYTTRRFRGFATVSNLKLVELLPPVPCDERVKHRVKTGVGFCEWRVLEGGSGSQGSDKTCLYGECWNSHQLQYKCQLSNLKEVHTCLGSVQVFDSKILAFIGEESDVKYARGFWDPQVGKLDPFDKFSLIPDYGETMTRVKKPVLFTFTLESGVLLKLATPSNIHPTFPRFHPISGQVFFSGIHIFSKTYIPGISRCFNRPSSIFRINSENVSENLTPNIYMALCPIFSPDGSMIVFAGHEKIFHTHCTELNLFVMHRCGDNWSAPVLLTKWGLYLSAQTESELIQFLPDNKTIIVPCFTQGTSCVYLIDTATGTIVDSLGPPCAPEHSSVVLQKVVGNMAIVLHTGYTCLKSLWLVFLSDLSKIEYVEIFSVSPTLQMNGFSNAQVRLIETDHCPAWLLQSGIQSDSPRPLIAYLHGGPHMAAINQFSVEFAAFLAQGYDIVIPNYRGSFSYGKPFLDALIGKAGIIDVADCHACVLKAIDQLKPNKVLAYGGSHGGFLTGWLLGDFKYNAIYNFGILWNPAVDLISSNLTSDIPDWAICEAIHVSAAPTSADATHNVFAPGVDFFIKAAEQSPMAVVDNVSVPTLVLLGEKDKRVVPCAGLRWAQAVERNSHPVEPTVMWYPDQGHAISGPEYYETAIVTIGLWIRKCLE